jgi:hypothetical protein
MTTRLNQDTAYEEEPNDKRQVEMRIMFSQGTTYQQCMDKVMVKN